MSEKITFVCATPKNKIDFESTFLYKLKTHDLFKKYNYDVYYENDKGLSTIYNKAIQKNINTTDIFVFIHDDVFINDLFFEEKIANGFHKYGFNILGVAGSKKINLDKKPISWFNSSFPNDMYGNVFHGKELLNNFCVSNYNASFCYERVITLDGLFLAVNAKVFNSTNLRFDENFKFNFYDIDFCFQAHKNNLTLGIVPLNIIHSSVGEGILKEDYTIEQTKFLKKTH